MKCLEFSLWWLLELFLVSGFWLFVKFIGILSLGFLVWVVLLIWASFYSCWVLHPSRICVLRLFMLMFPFSEPCRCSLQILVSVLLLNSFSWRAFGVLDLAFEWCLLIKSGRWLVHWFSLLVLGFFVLFLSSKKENLQFSFL